MKTRIVLGISLLLTMLGCSKLSLENYNKVAVGMRYDEVVTLLGAPGKCDDVMGVRNCLWGDEKRSVSVSFVGGKVLLYASSNLD